MKTPDRSTFLEFVEALTPYKAGLCPRCRTRLAVELAYVSVHTLDFDFCTGEGRMVRLEIPYCPTCEHVPQQFGCIHLAHSMRDVLIRELEGVRR